MSTLKKRLAPLTTALGAAALLVVFACSNNSGAKEKPKYTFKDGGKPGVALSINGKDFSDDELVGDQKMEFSEAYKRLHDLRMALHLTNRFDEIWQRAQPDPNLRRLHL